MSESKIYLLELKPQKALACWDKLEPLIERACSYSDDAMTPAAVKQKAGAGDYQIWAAFTPDGLKAVGVTCISNLGEKRVAELLLVAGIRHSSWLVFDEDLAAWARANDCEELCCRGRRGWAKTLPPTWEARYVRKLPPAEQEEAA